MKADTVTAICGVFIALCALGVSLWDSRATRDHNRRSAMPSLGTDQSFINGRYSLSVSNWGVGAAFVHWMRVFRNGELQEDLSRLLLEDRVGEAKVHEGFIYLVKQFSVAPNDKVTIFDVPFERERVEKLIRELRIEFCYCSIYDECWVGEVGHGPGKMILTQQHNSCD